MLLFWSYWFAWAAGRTAEAGAGFVHAWLLPQG